MNATNVEEEEESKIEPLPHRIPAPEDVPKLVPMKRVAAADALDEDKEEPDTTTTSQSAKRGRKKKMRL